MRMGLDIGIIYLVLVPISVFAVNGHLAGDASGMAPTIGWYTHQHTMLKILGMVGIYGIIDLVCHSFPPPPLYPKREGPSIWDALPTLKPLHLVVMFFVLSVALFIVTGMASGGHWADAKHDFLVSQGTPAMLVMNFHAAVRLATLIALAAWFMHDRVTFKWLASWMATLCALDLYTTGNRIFTLQALVVIAAILAVKERWFLLGMLSLAAIPFGISMMMFAMIRSHMHRWSGGFQLSSAAAAFGEGFQEAKDYYGPDLGIGNFLLGVTEGININVLVVVVEDFHRTLGMLWGMGILRGFTFWIPRSIWPGKPQNLSVLIGSYLMGGERRGVSMGATIFGEFWANFGFMGVFAIPVVIFIIDRILRKIILDPTMRLITVFMFGFTVVRLPISDFIVLTLFVVALLNMTRLTGKESGLAS